MKNSLINCQTNAELKEKYNPEGSQLRQIQYRELDILIEFDRICRKHNIDYWLDSGTLIGAVRHGGFIPWDDDIDVCILKKDRKRLRKAMAESLGNDFGYSEFGKENDYYKYSGLAKKVKRPVTRLYDKKASITRIMNGNQFVVSENLWLDIWEMAPGTILAKKIIEKTYGKCIRRVWNYVNDGNLKHIVAIIAYPVMIPLKLIIEYWCKIFHSGTLVSYGNTFYSTRKVSEVFPLNEIEFEGKMFKAPNNVDSYLRRIYGNYMEIPSTDKIETHNIIEIKVDGMTIG